MKNSFLSKQFINWFRPWQPILFLGIVLGLIVGPNAAGWNGRALGILSWVASLSIGTVAHELVILLWLKMGWLPERKTLSGMLPLMTAGAMATFFVLMPLQRYLVEYWPILDAFVSVLAVCALVQALIYPTKTYDLLLAQGARKKRERLLNRGEQVELIDQGERHLFAPRDIAAVKVQDHYLSFFYRTLDQWREVVVHGRLKDWEERLGGHLLRVNRSVLVNPAFVEALQRKGEKVFLRVQGIPESVAVSPSRVGGLPPFTEIS